MNWPVIVFCRTVLKREGQTSELLMEVWLTEGKTHAKMLDWRRLQLIISLFPCSEEERNKGQSPSQELPSSYSQLWHVDSPRQITFTLRTEFPFLLNWAQYIYPLLVFCADGLGSIWSPNMLKWLYGCNHIIKREMKGTLHLHSPVIVWLAPASLLKKHLPDKTWTKGWLRKGTEISPTPSRCPSPDLQHIGFI